MMTQLNRAVRVSLLAAVLLLTAAGCAGGKPASSAPEQVSAETNAGPARLSGIGSPAPSPGGLENGKAEAPSAEPASDPEPSGDGGAETPRAELTSSPEPSGGGESGTPGGEATLTPEASGEDGAEAPDAEPAAGLPVSPVVLASCGAAAVAVTAAAAVLSAKKKNARRQQDMSAANISKTENIRREPERRDMPNYQDQQNIAPAAPAAPGQSPRPEEHKGAYGTVQIGKLHNIGRRSVQQDSMGSMDLGSGSDVFAVVADGMGGLSGGDQVSQGVVMSMLQQAGSLGPGQMDGVLSAMVRSANEEINRQLGPDGVYHSGSTVVAVLVRGNVFHWISVGDSRIYLYRGGSMLQLNQEHTYEVELMQRVMNGEITAAEAASDPQRRGLTSFIGMGRLKYVDASRRPVMLQSGDRILLMTDGVFNNLPETAMADTLRRNPDVRQAAKVLEEQVLALQDAAQDNFTAIVLGFQG